MTGTFSVWGGSLRAAVLLMLLSAGTACGQTSEAADESLYERLGGLPAISLVLSDFVDEFIADPVIMANPAVREKKTPDAAPYVKFQLISLVCEMTGGPCEYTGLDLRTAHEGLNVSEDEWARMGEIFGRVLNEHNVPEREQGELFGMIGPTKDDIVVAQDR